MRLCARMIDCRPSHNSGLFTNCANSVQYGFAPLRRTYRPVQTLGLLMSLQSDTNRSAKRHEADDRHFGQNVRAPPGEVDKLDKSEVIEWRCNEWMNLRAYSFISYITRVTY